MTGVFINYRRDDAKSEAGRLFDWLSRYFGKDQVFMDVSGSIEPGLEFDKVIEKAVSSCDVLLVVIGKEWLTVADEKGGRRLADPNDFVRLEIAAALGRDIRVIPVLVQGAVMPDEDSLPENLKRLSRRQASEISDNRWEFDTEQLVKVLEKAGVQARPGQTVDSDEHAAPAPQAAKKSSWKAIVSLVVSVLLLISYEDLGADQDSIIGGLVFSLVALGLGIGAYYDAKHSAGAGRIKGKVLAITGMALAGILSLAFIGTMTPSDPPMPPVAVADAPPSSRLASPERSISTPPLPETPAAAFIDISGSWRGLDGIYTFQQSGNNINFQLYGWNQLLIAQGTGAIVQDVVTIAYVRIDNTAGEARLEVSADGMEMSGSYINRVTGEAGPVALVR